DEPRLAQHLEVLRHGRAADVEPAGQLADPERRLPEAHQDLSPDGVGQRGEDVDVAHVLDICRRNPTCQLIPTGWMSVTAPLPDPLPAGPGRGKRVRASGRVTFEGITASERGEPMRPDIVPGRIFPDYELPDHTSTPRKLSELQGDDPLIL